MASVRDRHNAFAPHKQLPHWSQIDQRGTANSPDFSRLPNVHLEPLRPIEPGDSQNASGHYSPSRPRNDVHMPQRPQLPGVQELLSPSVQRRAQSPATSGSWAPINNPPIWRDRLLSTSTGSSHSHTAPHAAAVTSHAAHPPPYRHHSEAFIPEQLRRGSLHLPMISSTNRAPSMSVMPLRQAEPLSPRSQGPPEYSRHLGDYFPTPSHHRDSVTEHMLERRGSSVVTGQPGHSSSLLMQIVGQRDIPGEGLCYVFKDGSTCPTVIDGEPVNPLWGTTKAGKARKRLAQACLNCREKKIKCEPGDTSCLQCEKAKRECLRPSAAQSQADMAAGAVLAMSTDSPEHGDWKSQPSPTSTSTTDIPAPKRRRSAHVAQQESSLVQSHSGAASPLHQPKRRKSDLSSSASMKSSFDRQRKDSKRPLTDEEEAASMAQYLAKTDDLAQCDDPFEIEPDGTKLFLDLFFAQSAHEVHMLFPRHAFTRWVETCNVKSRRESMVLYAVLALGSIFSNNEFPSFARLCIERATNIATNLHGQFSIALIQARLLLGAYNHLQGKTELAWDYNGSALRAIGAMKLNSGEGAGEDADEHARPSYNFTYEQLRECRRRTFWTAFLMDRYSSFNSGLLSTIQEDDVHIRLPCTEQAYEDGRPSTAPFFEGSGAIPGEYQSPAAYTITASVLWKEVVQFVHRSEHHPPSTYAARYEMFLSSIQRRLSDWNQWLPQSLKYSREALERAFHQGYAGDFISMHTLHLFSQLKAARTVRHELLTAPLVARSICTAHSHALQLLAIIRDIRVLTLSSPSSKYRTADFMSPFIAYAMTSAIDALGAGGLQEEIVATKQVLSTATDVLREVSQYYSTARVQLSMAEKRLAQIESWPPELDIRVGRGTDSRCWRITDPIEKAHSHHLQQDVMYGVSSSTFSEALTEGRKR